MISDLIGSLKTQTGFFYNPLEALNKKQQQKLLENMQEAAAAGSSTLTFMKTYSHVKKQKKTK